MDNDIKNKIKNVFGQREYCERDVVYFLIESYKFLEEKYGREFGASKYNRIKFYRNWASHAELNGDTTKVFVDFIKLIKECRSKSNASGQFDWNNSMTDEIKNRFRPYGPLQLRNEIKELQTEIGYGDIFNWESFRINLYEVIRDIPLTIKEKDDVFLLLNA